MQRATRILILTADYGSGHRSAAQALVKAFDQLYGAAAQVAVVNPLQHPSAPTLLRRAESLYLDEVQHTPTLYRLRYELTDLPLANLLLDSGARQMLRSTMRLVLLDHPADLVIGVFPLYTTAVAATYRSAPTRPGLMTVVTDLGAVHSMWFASCDDYAAVPTPVASEKALRCGLAAHQVVQTGIPVHPEFGARPADGAELRRSLGLQPDQTTVLLLGGGAGIGNLDLFAQAIDSANLPLQLVVVAGRNVALAAQLRARAWNIPVQIHEFVPLAPLMHAADIVATKAGGLTTSEALAAGKPLLIHGAIPGQEEGNLRYVQDEGAGVWTPEPADLVAQIGRWLARPAELRQHTAAACRLGRPAAAEAVARLAWQLAEAGPLSNRPESLGQLARRVRDLARSRETGAEAETSDMKVLMQSLGRQLTRMHERMAATARDQERLEAEFRALGPRAGTSWQHWLAQQRWLIQRQDNQLTSLERAIERLLAAPDPTAPRPSRAEIERLSRRLEDLDEL